MSIDVRFCPRDAIIIIIMFYYAIMAARHTVQYTHTVIQANTSTKNTKSLKKTVKNGKKRTELVKHVQH